MSWPENKPPEYWLVIAGMALYVLMRESETIPFGRRLTKTACSALLAVGLSPSLAPWLRGSESMSAVAVMAVGLLILDFLVALVQDREFMRDLVKRRLGGGS